ncbi:hypothetical protein BVG19_g3469 [[Candida] boidinii]|nr:hypothetical protein BVG19_g3469 [[Candida] boidinii]OWB52041.1 hypothetical protein B5S27_g3612 [[Candida] boidinii]OWB84406.1 hypothetical protein B5S33_g3051 [[Candida] boidinii]
MSLRRKLSLIKIQSQGEKLTRDATGHSAWGPSSQELNKISKLSFNDTDLKGIIKVLTKRFNSTDYISILKSLSIVKFILQTGSNKFLHWCNENKYFFINFLDYNPVDNFSSKLSINHSFSRSSLDSNLNSIQTHNPNNSAAIKSSQTLNIRNKSKDILRLIEDENYLKEQRISFSNLRSEMSIPGLHHKNSVEIMRNNELDLIDNEEIKPSNEFNRQLLRSKSKSRSSSSNNINRSTKSLEINRSQLFSRFNNSNISNSSDEDTEYDSNLSSPINSPTSSNAISLFHQNSDTSSLNRKSRSKLDTLVEEEQNENSNINSNNPFNSLINPYKYNNSNSSLNKKINENYNNSNSGPNSPISLTSPQLFKPFDNFIMTPIKTTLDDSNPFKDLN